ncbi:hypothetical protein ACIB24_13700 [Spongisporangium articulatum]|uniref:Uncharacterized protein n=1 Tax=Spongisporangium articulatum TaxID=3362603 RepID=A0ABW8AP49_9ACTN
MAQLTAPGVARRRPTRTMRTERVVSLRQTMPRGYVTLRKEVPTFLTEVEGTVEKTATPKVDSAARADETAVRKGGEAR